MTAVIAESEAEFAIVAAWHACPLVDKQVMNGMRFFLYLQRHQPHLLNFDARGGDPWQHVHCWLLRNGCVND